MLDEFKPFDKVLVRNHTIEDHHWKAALFSHVFVYPDGAFVYKVVSDKQSYCECVPYEGNEHLLNTAKDFKKEKEKSVVFDEYELVAVSNDKHVWTLGLYLMFCDEDNKHYVKLDNTNEIYDFKYCKRINDVFPITVVPITGE